MVCLPMKFHPAYKNWGNIALVLLLWTVPAWSNTWRIGDTDQPWRLHPVSTMMDAGEAFKPDFIWGGNHAIEVVVDDDGDGLIDEDPVDLTDDDGDGVYNEDPEDGLDNDKDGAVDEDGPDPQMDNDGDGMLNEDGLMLGGIIYYPDVTQLYEGAPFFRHATSVEAAADPLGPGYGFGDDDHDSRFNEDPLDGVDNDQDGLIDEDDVTPPANLPLGWTRKIYAYDVSEVEDVDERKALAFRWDSSRSLYVAQRDGGEGDEVEASQTSKRFTPIDWIRPIKLDEKRNVIRVINDRFLSGIFGRLDPIATNGYRSHLSGTTRQGDAGYGQMVDGNIFTARRLNGRTGSSGFTAELFGRYFIDLIRIRPRPDFPDRTPTSFKIYYAGDEKRHFQSYMVLGEVSRRLVINDFIIPMQVDQARPPVKEFLFEKEGDLGEPKRVQVLDFRSDELGGHLWEIAEFEAYGHGYAMGASYVTEIIDVGQRRPIFRRYFDREDRERPVTFESVLTIDTDRSGSIEPEEQSKSLLEDQFNTEATGQLMTWGKVRWRGQIEGLGGRVHVRLRAGTSPDTRVYQRKVGRGVFSPFINDPLVIDWPKKGSRVDAFSYVALSGLERPRTRVLPFNVPGEQDGTPGGWSPWSAPFDFDAGLVDENGEGGVLMQLPALSRYIQFRLDFESLEESSVRVDYLEFEYGQPVVGRGVVAEIYPGSADLGVPESFEYVLRPDFNERDIGFNRIDIAVPSSTAQVEGLVVDDQPWNALPASAGSLLNAKVWLDTLTISTAQSYASAVYVDSMDGRHKLGIKVGMLDESDFPRGQERDIQIRFQSPVFQLLTEFGSWVWNDRLPDELSQLTTPGNAADRLPLDQVQVTVRGTDKSLDMRRVGPNPFSPNGDGINDAIEFDVDIFLLTTEVEVYLTIYDLSGQIAAQIKPSGVSAGQLNLSWDGRSTDGSLVPPGIYVYQLSVDSDTEKSKNATGSLGVVY